MLGFLLYLLMFMSKNMSHFRLQEIDYHIYCITVNYLVEKGEGGREWGVGGRKNKLKFGLWGEIQSSSFSLFTMTYKY
jgi:hypothetical protein